MSLHSPFDVSYRSFQNKITDFVSFPSSGSFLVNGSRLTWQHPPWWRCHESKFRDYLNMHVTWFKIPVNFHFSCSDKSSMHLHSSICSTETEATLYLPFHPLVLNLSPPRSPHFVLIRTPIWVVPVAATAKTGYPLFFSPFRFSSKHVSKTLDDSSWTFTFTSIL